MLSPTSRLVLVTFAPLSESHRPAPAILPGLASAVSEFNGNLTFLKLIARIAVRFDWSLAAITRELGTLQQASTLTPTRTADHGPGEI